MASSVKVFGVWGSPFSRRVEIALQLKGVEYEIVEEDLDNKSQQLLEYNPIHKKIPVLVHDGKPVVESLVILEYIDETWKENPLLPSDPYERAQVRFWAKFIDEKVVAAIFPVLISQGEETQKRVEELHGYLTLLENEMVKKKLFGGNNKIGWLDILGLFLVHWLPLLAQVTGKDDMNVITREQFPGIYDWGDEVLQNNVIQDNLPDKTNLLQLLQSRFGPKENASPNK